MYTYSTYLLLHVHAQQDVDVHDTMIYICFSTTVHVASEQQLDSRQYRFY